MAFAFAAEQGCFTQSYLSKPQPDLAILGAREPAPTAYYLSLFSSAMV